MAPGFWPNKRGMFSVAMTGINWSGMVVAAVTTILIGNEELWVGTTMHPAYHVARDEHAIHCTTTKEKGSKSCLTPA